MENEGGGLIGISRDVRHPFGVSLIVYTPKPLNPHSESNTPKQKNDGLNLILRPPSDFVKTKKYEPKSKLL